MLDGTDCACGADAARAAKGADGMDTSILSTLREIAPDLMQEMEVRALILERVAALGPVGRRALAMRLHLPERNVRSAADALRQAGLIAQSAAGMEITAQGKALTQTARIVSRERRSLASVELKLSRRLNVQRVCVVHGDADEDASISAAAACAAAQQIRFLLQDARVLAVSGGEILAQAAEAIDAAAPMDITVVPAQGGMSGSVRTQANAVAEAFAVKLGGHSRALHLPEGAPAAMIEELARIPQVREALELIAGADVMLYGIERAMDAAVRRGMSAAERETLAHSGALAEAAGLFLDEQGRIVGGRTIWARYAQGVGRADSAAVAVGRSRAEAIMAVCAHHRHRLLITDEGAALRMIELLRI